MEGQFQGRLGRVDWVHEGEVVLDALCRDDPRAPGPRGSRRHLPRVKDEDLGLGGGRGVDE